jgi:methylmalonyl-CoA mutase
MPATSPLFPEFSPVSAAEWKARIVKDLKGESFESLTWKNENGFDVKPIYTAEDLRGEYPPLFQTAHWEIAVEPPGTNVKETNAFLKKWLDAGATGLWLNIASIDPAEALKGIDLMPRSYAFTADTASVHKLGLLRNADSPEEVYGAVFPSTLSDKNALGAWWNALRNFTDLEMMRLFCIDVTPFHRMGALPYYEAAVFLSQAAAWMSMARDSGNSLPSRPAVVRTATGTQYFTEIAKLRAMRKLFELLRNEFGLPGEIKLEIHCETTMTNLSAGDSYTNLLRTAVGAMAAVTGGCDMLLVRPFDAVAGRYEEFSQRLAINQQLLLREESHLAMFTDAAAGSYYIESLTDLIATRALETFKAFEKSGGYFACLANGTFNRDIEKMAEARRKRVFSGDDLVVGVNRFASPQGKAAKTAVAAGDNAGSFNPVYEYEQTKPPVS